MSIIAVDIIVILVSWTALSALNLGLGVAFRRAFGLKTLSTQTAIHCFWLGYAVSIAVLQLWHLFFPIEVASFGILFAGAIAGFAWNGRELLAWLSSIRNAKRMDVALLLMFILAEVVLADVAIGGVNNYDTGLYDFSALRWDVSYPIVPGLANLYSRLGFNNSSTLYYAMIEGSFWPQRALHIATGVLCAGLWAQIIHSFGALFRTDGEKAAFPLGDLFVIFMAPKVIEASFFEIGGFSTDFPIIACGVLVTSQMLHLAARAERPRRETAFLCLCAGCLATLGVTIKLSFVAMGGLVFPLALYLWYRARREFAREDRAVVLAGIAFSALLFGTWILRNILLTGYPAFPQTWGKMPVDWRVPRHAAEVTRNWIVGWARKPWVHWSDSINGWAWVPGWAEMVGRGFWDIQAPLALFALSLIGFALLRIKKWTPRTNAMHRGWWLVLPASASLVFWFFTAPTPRLGAGNTWVFAALFAALLAYRVWSSLEIRGVTMLFLLSPAILLIVAALCTIHPTFMPGPDDGYYPPAVVGYSKYVCASKLVVLVPKDPGNPQLWDAPLPATPYPHPHLSLRKPNDLGSGFRIDPFDENIINGIPR